MTSSQFWTNDTSILLKKNQIFELWPTNGMTYEQKMNAMTRLVIVLTILGYFLTYSIKILTVGIVTLFLLVVLYNLNKQKLTREMLNEGFENGDSDPLVYNSIGKLPNPVNLDDFIDNKYQNGTKKNPFSNVLLTEIMDNPERKAAPPSYNPDIEEDITSKVKKSVQFMNPSIQNTSKQLFGDLWDKFTLDQSNRVFFSTANTKIPNDQGAFAQFLYNDLKYSGKESTPEGAIARVQDNVRYLLY